MLFSSAVRLPGKKSHVFAQLCRRLSVLALLTGLSLSVAPVIASDADVVVVGGTPGGIATAVSAARNGQKVVLVAARDHVGGMMTSGLGKSDIENRAMIGGLFREMITRVHDHYVRQWGADHENVRLCRDGYYYEPSVAEAVLNEMLSEESSITVMTGWQLQQASVTDDRLHAATFIRRGTSESRTINAPVFVDATYEGDLIALSGARFRVGREARQEFNEPHAGVVYFDYQQKEFLSGTTGKGDDALPAWTYRLCLTTDPENAVPLTEPPPQYNRANYTAYFDDLAAGRLDAPKKYKPGRGYNPAHFGTLVRALSVTEIPGGKTDVNINPRPLAFPFPEENRGYLDNFERREQIETRHRNLTLGLLWFLQNDPEVPEEHRRLARELHLPKDEFTDNGHFPFQLYIREGRRLVGEYVMTEHDITGDGTPGGIRRHDDCIAIGEFPIDSFPCHKQQPGDSVVLEGYLGMLDHITRPYQIPYRIMIPERIDGLIVPVAASTTHVAYSSVRMEPTWMALGQAAGVAAALANETEQPLRSVPVPELQQRLQAQGQVLDHDKAQEPHPELNPKSPVMLKADWVPEDPHQIDFAGLPRLKLDHVIVSDVRESKGVNQHNYLTHFDGRYWLMWSDGPGVEDRVGQRVKYSTSADGLTWSSGQYMTPIPDNSGPDSPHYNTRTTEGWRWISRGFWQRDGELLALASLDEAAGFFGPGLELHAFRWNRSDSKWEDLGVIADNSINNFPPKKIASGQWMMSRRPWDYKKTGVQFLVGGVEALDSWESFPVLGSNSELTAEEPLWWALPDGNLMALFRDNRRSGYLYRSFSADQGRNWSLPVKTDFPDATSKLNGQRLQDGRYVLVSNANPRKRDPLVLSVSEDGMVFDRMAYLFGGRRVDYPHVMEHNGFLFVAFSGGKQSVELVRIKLEELNRIDHSASR